MKRQNFFIQVAASSKASFLKCLNLPILSHAKGPSRCTGWCKQWYRAPPVIIEQYQRNLLVHIHFSIPFWVG